MKRYVIIGGGVAAVGCIEGIRSRDTEGTITVISEENHPVYCRPLISYYLEGKTDPKRMLYRDPSFYEQMNVTLLTGKRAVGIDPNAQRVLLDDETKVPYDALCVAAGSRPFVPPMPGLETVSRKYAFMTLDDALELEKVLSPAARVLIIGGGLIGLKCAEGLCGRVAKITVCDLADRILSSILDRECAALMQARLEQQGIRFLLSDSVARFTPDTALMNSGIRVPFDIVVLAVGVRANTELVREIGGAVGRGIVVDEHMRTSLSGIYAAGDCTEAEDISCGARKVMAILPNAVLQGYTAGENMAGGTAVFDKGIPMNSIGFFGLHAMTAGSYEGDVYEEKTDHSLKRLFTKDDLLKGFILIGCGERAGILTSMIREKTPISSVDFELMKKGATTAAFSPDARRKKFGGMV